MNGIDKLFRARVTEWLSKKKHTEAELADGAMMVLQCNRNHALYNTIMRRPSRYEEKIAYELRKHLRYLKDDLTLDEVKEKENKVLPVIEKVLNVDVNEDKPLPSPAYDAEAFLQTGTYKQTDTIVARGKRPDHDSLPETIRAIWDKNAERYKKIKQAHETCKTLTAACDRYEFTSAIAELWADYKKDFDTYDHYVLVPVNDEAGTQTPTGEEVQLSAEDMKEINNARSYISKNLQKLLDIVSRSTLSDFSEQKEMESWRERIQQRVDVLIRTKQVITDDLKALLLEAGVNLEPKETDGQGQEHSDDTPATE